MGQDITHQDVKDYYGKELQQSDDLKTNACCTTGSYPTHIKNALKNIHDEVLIKYYGCGLTIPTSLKGKKILDLGSGSGRDVYLAAQLVGEEGEVVGVDMTDEQLDVANRHLDFHQDKFGFKKGNVKFLKGNIDELASLDIPDNYFDIIISNCVINLCMNKEEVLSQCFKKLKNGGEMYFSDVYSNKRVPKDLQNNKILWGECLSGALYWNDFLNLSKKAGFTDPRKFEDEIITVNNGEVQKLTEGFEFYSVTYRLFKIEGLEPDHEDYGQAVRYKGTIKEMSQTFQLDDQHFFEKGRIEKVSGNSFRMLHDTRLKEHFDFFGDFENHLGIFEESGTSFQVTNSKLNNVSEVEDKKEISSGSSCC